jgi:hypothetical protein
MNDQTRVSSSAMTDASLPTRPVEIDLGVMPQRLTELSFHVYSRPRELAALLAASLLENFGYRQLNSVWRLWGLLHWTVGAKSRWGEMTRSTAWQRPE